MITDPTVSDYVVSLLLCLVLLPLVTWKVCRRIGIRPDVSVILLVSIVALAFVRYMLELEQPADSTGYYNLSLGRVYEFDVGTDFITYFTGVWTKYLGLGFMPTMILYSIFPAFAVPLFYGMFLRLGGVILHPLLHAAFLTILLTSTAFWGAGIGKDGVALLAVALLCWGLAQDAGRLRWLVAAVILMTLVRPHMGVLMLVGIGVGVLLGRQAKLIERVVVLGLGLAGAFVIVPMTITYIGLNTESSLEEIIEGNEDRIQGFEDTGSFVDISSMSPPVRMLTYVFRPMPWEATSIVQLFASLQNVVLLLVMFLWGTALLSRSADIFSFRQLVLISFGLLALGLMAMTTANLGISTRQKWMAVLPLMFVVQNAFAVRLHRRRQLAAAQAQRRFRRDRPGYAAHR